MSIKAEEQVLPVELEELERLRRRVLALAEERGLTQRDMEKAARVAHSTYDGMWKRGTVTLLRLERIAKRLGMDLATVLSGGKVSTGAVSVVSEPQSAYGQPVYLEQRVERLEAEMRQMKLQLKKS